MDGIGWILFCASRRLLSSSMAAASAIITLAEDVIETELLVTEGFLVMLIWTTGRLLRDLGVSQGHPHHTVGPVGTLIHSESLV